MFKKTFTIKEVKDKLNKHLEDIKSGKIKTKPIQTVEATEFVKSQINHDIKKYLVRITKDTFDILNLYPQDCPKGLYSFSRIVPLYNDIYKEFKSRIVKITSKNEKYLKTDYVARREGEIPYLKRWFPKNSPVKTEKSDHIEVILYNREQLKKEGTPIKSHWGIVCINIETGKHSPISPTTMINNQLGIKFGGNGEKIDKKKYLDSVEFWKKHALLEK